MGIKTFLGRMLGLDGRGTEKAHTEAFLNATGEIYVRELAFWSCVNLVANAVSKCEIKTFYKGKEEKGPEYYRWNLSPNCNQSSSAFLHQWIAQLYRNNEALVVEVDGQRLVADSFACREYALRDTVFEQVQVGDFTFRRTFTQSEVLYLRLSEKDMRQVTNGLYRSYQNMIAYGMKAYQQSRGKRGILGVSAMAQKSGEFEKNFKKLMDERFRTFFEAENAVLPLFDGYSYTELDAGKTCTSEGTRDIRAMIDDVSDFTAKAFGIPPALLSGEVQGTQDALDQFLTFCIDPLCDMLQEEINRKLYGQAGYLAGSFVRIDTKCIRHVDLLSVSTAIDKLIASGAFCINDIRELVGEPPLDGDWASQHFITKNYATVQSLLTALQAESMDTG